MASVATQQRNTTVGFAPSTERRHAVLLCSELRGLARMSEALDARLVLTLANEFFTFAADIVSAAGGEPLAPQHDVLLSAFLRGNAAQAAQQAVRAAQRVQGEFPALAEKWRAAYGLRSAVAQGLHLGEVVFGMTGPRGHEHRGAFGDAVTLAQVMQHRARAGEFVMTDAVMGALSVDHLNLDAEPLPHLALRGRPEMRIYGVLAASRIA